MRIGLGSSRYRSVGLAMLVGCSWECWCIWTRR